MPIDKKVLKIQLLQFEVSDINATNWENEYLATVEKQCQLKNLV